MSFDSSVRSNFWGGFSGKVLKGCDFHPSNRGWDLIDIANGYFRTLHVKMEGGAKCIFFSLRVTFFCLIFLHCFSKKNHSKLVYIDIFKAESILVSTSMIVRGAIFHHDARREPQNLALVIDV